MVPAEVLTWVRDVFGSCNRAVTAQLSNNPNAAEESFDHAWIAHLNDYATPRRLGNGWTVKIETHFLGGMRHFGRWEIADIGILLFIRDPVRVATRKVALLQSKRLYPTTMTVREETTVDYEIGFARLADPSDLARSIAYESQFTFNTSCRYGELVADSDQVRAITEFQRDIGPTVYYHLYNPWRLPYRITVPTDRRRRFRGDPSVGVRVLGSTPVHGLLQARTPGHRPTYGELVEECGPGWTLPEFMADELVACREGYRYEENDNAIFNVFNRRSGAIAAAIALTLEAPEAIDQ